MRGEQAKVSVIIPAYNAAAYISSAIESVLQQTYPHFEIIVIDDGSTDATQEVLQPYREKGLITCLSQSNSGPATARNSGLPHAHGRYISFLDADDMLTPAYLESSVEFMEDFSGLDFIFSNYAITEAGCITCASGVDKWKAFRTIPHVRVSKGRWIFTESLTSHIIAHGGFMTTSAVMLRKSALNGAAVFRDGFFYGEDDELFARITYRAKSGYIDEVLLTKRVRSGSIIHNRSVLLRNIRHFIRLSEIEMEYFSNDMTLQSILRKKIPRLVYDYCWELQAAGKVREAQRALIHYIKKYKMNRPLYKLLIKNYLLRVRQLHGGAAEKPRPSAVIDKG